MKKLTLLTLLLLPNLIIAQAMPQGLDSLDNEYLESLPEAVRDDLQAEIERNKKQEDSSLKKRPSSELLKYDLINEWEQFKRIKNEGQQP